MLQHNAVGLPGVTASKDTVAHESTEAVVGDYHLAWAQRIAAAFDAQHPMAAARLVADLIRDGHHESNRLRDNLAWLAKNSFYISDDSTSAASAFRVRTVDGDPVGPYGLTPIEAVEAARANPLAPR